MAKWWVLAGIFFIIVLIGGIYVGRSYQHWVRAQAKIGELSSDLQEQAWRDFEGYAPGVMTGGILAGSAGDRIWVWNKLGVETLRVDENTVYSWFDGCSAEPLAELNQGIVGAVRRYLITDKDACGSNQCCDVGGGTTCECGVREQTITKIQKEEAFYPISNMTSITGLSDIQCYTFLCEINHQKE